MLSEVDTHSFYRSYIATSIPLFSSVSVPRNKAISWRIANLAICTHLLRLQDAVSASRDGCGPSRPSTYGSATVDLRIYTCSWTHSSRALRHPNRFRTLPSKSPQVIFSVGHLEHLKDVDRHSPLVTSMLFTELVKNSVNSIVESLREKMERRRREISESQRQKEHTLHYKSWFVELGDEVNTGSQN